MILFLGITSSWAQQWTRIATAQGGGIDACAEYAGELFIAGDFREIDSQKCTSYARWDGNALTRNRSILGRIRAFSIHKNELYALGQIDRGLVKWNGTRFESFDLLDGNGSALYSDGDNLFYGTENGILKKYDEQNGVVTLITPEPGKEIKKIIKFNDELIVAGNFDSLRNIVVWRNNKWQSLGYIPYNGQYLWVSDLEVFKGELYAIGSFKNARTRIMKWNGADWLDVGDINSIQPPLYFYDMLVFKGELYVTGRFIIPDRKTENGIVRWDGNNWSDQAFEDTIGMRPNALGTFNNRLVVGMYDYFSAHVYLGEDRSQTDEISIPHFSVYPNPAANKIHIKLLETDAVWQNNTATIIDVSGKRLYHGIWKGNAIDINYLNHGVYSVILSQKDGSRRMSKFVVAR